MLMYRNWKGISDTMTQETITETSHGSTVIIRVAQTDFS